MRLDEQVVWLTGAAGAVGRHLVADLAGAARAVVALDRDAEGLEALAAEHDGVVARACDLADPDAVDAAATALCEEGHEPTVLVNNAGLIHNEPLVDLLGRGERRHRVETWRRTLDANLTATFCASAVVAERMAERRTRGLIVNVSSVAAAGNAGQSAYAAAKAAVEALAVTWAQELGPLGIRCVAIAPGFLDTPSTHAALSEKQLQAWRRRTPLGRLGTPEELARALRFVIEDDFFDGRVLALDGGLRL